MHKRRRRSVQIAVVAATVVGALFLMYYLRAVFNPFLLAMALAYILNPLVRGLEKRCIPRKIAIGGMFLGLLIALLVSGLLLVPRLYREASSFHVEAVGEEFYDHNRNGRLDEEPSSESFTDQNRNGSWDPGEPFIDANRNGEFDATLLPDSWDPRIHDRNRNGRYDEGYLPRVSRRLREAMAEDGVIRDFLAKIIPPERLDGVIAEAMATAKSQLRALAGSLGDLALGAWDGSMAGVSWVWEISLLVLLTPIYLAFLLNSISDGWDLFLRYTPGRIRPRLVDILRKIDLVISAFFRGRLLVCTAIGLVTAIGFAACEVRFGILFGLLIGILSFIPFLNILGFLPALLSCWVAGFTFWQYAFVLVVYAIGQALDPLLTSLVLGKDLQLHPVTILLSIFVCSALFGFFGMLLAVPIVATLKILGKEFLLPSLEALASETAEGETDVPPPPGTTGTGP